MGEASAFMPCLRGILGWSAWLATAEQTQHQGQGSVDVLVRHDFQE